ncbi:calcineurin subunit B-like [Salvia splendens]|uniref:calcineurin subunit B-like n=1 Tax=Salvia splendens TaxID=180675 RepID=UPI001C2711AA|nr:calcineurin subunit B-like [Salvia splendens]
MGSALSVFTQYDIEEVQEHCNHLFTQQEIVSLYKRFYQLDRNSKGFISSDEFLSVPEFAMNPLSQEVLSQLLQEAGYTKSRLLCWTTPSRYWIIKV